MCSRCFCTVRELSARRSPISWLVLPSATSTSTSCSRPDSLESDPTGRLLQHVHVLPLRIDLAIGQDVALDQAAETGQCPPWERVHALGRVELMQEAKHGLIIRRSEPFHEPLSADSIRHVAY